MPPRSKPTVPEWAILLLSAASALGSGSTWLTMPERLRFIEARIDNLERRDAVTIWPRIERPEVSGGHDNLPMRGER